MSSRRKGEDEYGYNPDESYFVEDNPFWDGTDGAHPAWWRGSDHAFECMCAKLQEILDGKEPIGKAREPWETIRRRIYDLVKE